MTIFIAHLRAKLSRARHWYNNSVQRSRPSVSPNNKWVPCNCRPRHR